MGGVPMKWVWASLWCLLAAASVPAGEPVAAAGDAGPEVVVEGLLDAFNRHDVDAMLALMAPDVRWVQVDNATAGTSFETVGHEEMRKGMAGYFKAIPSARSTLRFLSAGERTVFAIEEASWEREGERRSQCSVASYEIIDGKVATVWYGPAQPCD